MRSAASTVKNLSPRPKNDDGLPCFKFGVIRNLHQCIFGKTTVSSVRVGCTEQLCASLRTRKLLGQKISLVWNPCFAYSNYAVLFEMRLLFCFKYRKIVSHAIVSFGQEKSECGFNALMNSPIGHHRASAWCPIRVMVLNSGVHAAVETFITKIF